MKKQEFQKTKRKDRTIFYTSKFLVKNLGIKYCYQVADLFRRRRTPPRKRLQTRSYSAYYKGVGQNLFSASVVIAGFWLILSLQTCPSAPPLPSPPAV